MSSSSRRAVDRSYHPRGGLGMSASLQRARAPFFYRNMIVGTIVAGFIVGVYSYSISAVKQDDFSDVEDLLPPLEQRQQMMSIEDEMREKGQNPYPTTPLSPNNPSSLSARSSKNADIPYSVSSASANSRGLPGQPGTSLGSSSTDLGDVAGRPRESWVMSLLPSRLDKSEWVQRRGWVEEGRGNVLVWGAPSVDNIGTVHDSKQTRGPRLV